MIKLENLTKFYPSKLGNQYIFKRINFEIPSGHNLAILGSNGAGKSTLFRLLAGSEYPNEGRVITDLNLSWPVALATGIHPQMTGRENTRFIGMINGVVDLDDYVEKVQEFSDLGKRFDLPVKTYSSGMRPRLAFACSIAIDFDVYLIDEVTSVGDAKFRAKAKRALLAKRHSSNVIMVSHNMGELRQFCDSALVLHKGQMTFYQDLERGIAHYKAL
ncbi:ABC transporter ATP-binding protein [Ferrimonas marina]|uniref:Capsular polysaccharide transport system ATP-binding protein n=1 Tax=Ferrimonas marina TaxID=299255 RepID=A0A1M5VKR6_9GAMM|nr:ABC transporter ATP-binding protein [Ferrimonas marina]SHH75634.1 capsular polysaccharide transport system ATP-binding protein [Ferrimonas marina]